MSDVGSFSTLLVGSLVVTAVSEFPCLRLIKTALRPSMTIIMGLSVAVDVLSSSVKLLDKLSGCTSDLIVESFSSTLLSTIFLSRFNSLSWREVVAWFLLEVLKLFPRAGVDFPLEILPLVLSLLVL